MGDLTRLLRYAFRYRGRLALGIASAIIGSILLGAFVSLIKPITEQVLRDSAPPSVTVPAAGEAVSAGEGAGSGDSGHVPSELPGWVSRLRQRVERLAAPLRAYLAESPFVRLPVLIVILFLLRGAFGYLAETSLRRVGLRVILDLRRDLFGRVVHQSDRFFRYHPTGLLMSRVMGDVARIQRLLSANFGHALRVVVTVILMVVLALYHSWQVTLLCLAGMPLVAVPMVRFGKRLKQMSTRSQERSAEISSVLNEAIRGNRIVQGFGMESFEIRRFSSGLERMFRVDLKAARAVALSPAIMEFIGALFSAGVLAFAGWRIAGGLLGPGDLMVVLVALGLIFTGVKRLTTMNNDMQQALAAARRVFAMMDTPREVQERDGAAALPRFTQELRFHAVGFAYDRQPVLRGVDLTVRRGEVHALVGASGVGKTTLVSLVPRFYDPTAGKVTVDGIDVSTVTLRSLRDQIALVTQEMVLFNDSVRNNIAYGRGDVSPEAVEAAARAAHAHEFVEQLPRGYDTEVGEGGARLSAGQRQRITIARALLKDAPILILDEATSALDTESEWKVQEALDRLMEGRTNLVIAHRLSTVRRATRIHVLDQGRIVESDAHDELLARGGLYARLYAMQFREGALPTPGA